MFRIFLAANVFLLLNTEDLLHVTLSKSQNFDYYFTHPRVHAEKSLLGLLSFVAYGAQFALDSSSVLLTGFALISFYRLFFSLQFDPAPRRGEPHVTRRTPDYFL